VHAKPAAHASHVQFGCTPTSGPGYRVCNFYKKLLYFFPKLLKNIAQLLLSSFCIEQYKQANF
jgi:hypothetical protein